MTQQSEAQRLADELDAYHTASHHKQASAELRRFAALVAAAEREACAVLCDQLSDSSRDLRFGSAIRARGQE